MFQHKEKSMQAVLNAKKKIKFLETQAHNVMSALWCCQFHTVVLNYCLKLRVIQFSCANCNPYAFTHGCTYMCKVCPAKLYCSNPTEAEYFTKQET